MPVRVPHEVRRLALGTAHLDDLAELVLLSHDAAVDVQVVTGRCVHGRPPPDWSGWASQTGLSLVPLGSGYRE